LDLPEQHRESLRESTFEPVEGRYERWLGALWVGDLYIAMLEGRDPEWYEKPVGSLELPAEFVELLLELERVHKSWFGHRREDIPAMSEAREQADRAINDYVDRTGLPRWPFGIGAEDSQPDRPFG
jgi:hypothetical protein